MMAAPTSRSAGEDGVDRLADRRFDAEAAGQGGDGRRGGHALGHGAAFAGRAARGSRRGRAPGRRSCCATGGLEQVSTRSPRPQRPATVSASPPSATARRVSSAKPRVIRAALGAAAQARALDDAAGDGQDVLHRPAGLGADHVVGQVGAERRGGDALRPGAAARSRSAAGQGDGGGQAARHLAGEAGAGQHRRRARRAGSRRSTSVISFSEPCSTPLAHSTTGGPASQVRREGGQGGAQMLGRGDGEDDVGVGQVGRDRRWP